MKITKRWLRKLAVALIVGYLVANSGWIRASSFTLVSPSCDSALLTDARNRVTTLLGEVISEPIFACSATWDAWLGVEYGKTNFAIGLPPAISIGPSGMNRDVVAHEWVHAQLYTKTGFLARELKIPVWFDEGLAMQIDHRDSYSKQALAAFNADETLDAPSYSRLGSSDFFASGAQGRYHYALSRCLVGAWLRSGGKVGDVPQTIDFVDVYGDAIESCSGFQDPAFR